MAITEISVSKIYILATEPTNKVKDRFWFDTTNNLLKRYDGTSWKPISVSSDDVVVLSSGNKVSLTNYLNTQIAALAEGIDSKQNKLLCYSETIPTDKSYPEEVVITAKGQDFLAAHGAGTITLLATDSTDSGDDFAPGTINLNASKVLKNGGDIATTGDLANKQNKLQTYSESDPSSGLPSAAITAEVGLSLDSKQIKIGGGIFNSETIIDGWSHGYAGTSKIKVNGSSISLQTLTSDYEGSSIELTQNTLAINSDNGITGNILEKTISSSSVDTKIPTAKAVKDALDTKQDKLKYYSEVSGDTPSATISVANIKLNGKVSEGFSTTASGYCSHAEGAGTTASGDYSHAEGSDTIASGGYSHAEGIFTTSSGDWSHAEGYYTKSSGNYQHVQGKFNIEDTNNKYADIIGNGYYKEDDTLNRSNAATVSWEGISWSQTDVRAGGTDQDSATYSLSALAEGKQDRLVFYHEDTSTNQEASIQNADSFSIQGTTKGLILDGNNGGITIKNGNFNTGQAVISLEVNNWEDNSDAILFSVDGDSIKMTDAFLIPEIKNKQNSTDTALNTTNKTIVGAINELLASINANVITSTEQKRITTTSTASGIQMSTTAKVCMVSINPVTTNVGAIYISTSSDTAPTINPLYPDQMPKYKFPDASQVYIWSDVNGDSVDLTIEYYG